MGGTRRLYSEGIKIHWYEDLHDTTSKQTKTKIILVQAHHEVITLIQFI